MDWYYAEAGQQKGPVTEAEFERLRDSGVIRDDTLVWREGMVEWQAYAQMQNAAVAAAPPGGLICSECGRSFPEDQVIRHGEGWVCAGCKPVFLQKLREGAPVATGLELAGFWLRGGAKILDQFILMAANMAIAFVMGMAAGPTLEPEEGSGAWVAVQLVWYAISLGLTLAYYVYFHGRFGATPGKMACKIKVVIAGGEPIGYGIATGRFFAEILSGIICYIGYIMAGFDDERRALHDRLCNTRVVKT